MDEFAKQAILQKIQELKGLRIFYNMDERDIFEVMKRCQTHRYTKGDLVFSEGDEDNSLYVIVEGEFEISSQTDSGENLRYFCAGQGLVFGEMAFLDTQPRSASITAIEDGEVFKITREAFDDLFEQQTKTAARFMMGVAEIISRRMRGANRRIKFIST